MELISSKNENIDQYNSQIEVIVDNQKNENIDQCNSQIKVVVDNQVDNHSTVLKYRAATYDIYDERYATILLKIFNNLPDFIKCDFNNITDNLMSCNRINRYCLLDAIRDFKDCNPHINKNYMWIGFNDSAFNCRPYQCIIN